MRSSALTPSVSRSQSSSMRPDAASVLPMLASKRSMFTPLRPPSTSASTIGRRVFSVTRVSSCPWCSTPRTYSISATPSRTRMYTWASVIDWPAAMSCSATTRISRSRSRRGPTGSGTGAPDPDAEPAGAGEGGASVLGALAVAADTGCGEGWI